MPGAGCSRTIREPRIFALSLLKTHAKSIFSQIPPRRKNIVYLRSRPESIDKKIPGVREDALVQTTLRQRPDASFLGEARGQEILPLIQSLSTGLRNGFTSIHANSIEEAFDRILIMLNMSEEGRRLSEHRAANLVALAFNVLVYVKRDRFNKAGRSVSTIAEYTGKVIDRDTVSLSGD